MNGGPICKLLCKRLYHKESITEPKPNSFIRTLQDSFRSMEITGRRLLTVLMKNSDLNVIIFRPIECFKITEDSMTLKIAHSNRSRISGSHLI
jgi:hypothetical protein